MRTNLINAGKLFHRIVAMLALFALLLGALSPLGHVVVTGDDSRQEREIAALLGNSIAICTASGIRFTPASQTEDDRSPGDGQAVPWACPYCLLQAAGIAALPAAAPEVLPWRPGQEPAPVFYAGYRASGHGTDHSPGAPRGPPSPV